MEAAVGRLERNGASSVKKRLLVVIVLCAAATTMALWLFRWSTDQPGRINVETALFPEQQEVISGTGENKSQLSEEAQDQDSEGIPPREEVEKNTLSHHSHGSHAPRDQGNGGTLLPDEETVKGKEESNSQSSAEQGEVEGAADHEATPSTLSTTAASGKEAPQKAASSSVTETTEPINERESTVPTVSTASTQSKTISATTATTTTSSSSNNTTTTTTTTTNSNNNTTTTNTTAIATTTNNNTPTTATATATATTTAATTTETQPPSIAGQQKSNDQPLVVTVTIYIEMFASLDRYYPGFYQSLINPGDKNVCPQVSNTRCVFRASNPHADVVFRQVGLYRNLPENGVTPAYRYCGGQIAAVMNTEAEMPSVMEDLRMADIKVNFHPSSDVIVTDACKIPWKPDLYSPPDPSKRKGIALLMSNCAVEWRNTYLDKLARSVKIYSYGKCFHNVDEPSSRADYMGTFDSVASKHRMVVTFENTLQSDYISEKISLCYRSGVIPVYWGPPEIYQWVPGNHSFIDAQKFKGPVELAKYLQRVDEDDDLFRYHTTKFDYSMAEKTHKQRCKNSPFYCQVCQRAREIKLEREKTGQTSSSQSCHG